MAGRTTGGNPGSTQPPKPTHRISCDRSFLVTCQLYRHIAIQQDWERRSLLLTDVQARGLSSAIALAAFKDYPSGQMLDE
jgi:hypothetical protein